MGACLIAIKIQGIILFISEKSNQYCIAKQSQSNISGTNFPFQSCLYLWVIVNWKNSDGEKFRWKKSGQLK